MSLCKRDQFTRKWKCLRCGETVTTYHYPGDDIRPVVLCSVCVCRQVEKDRDGSVPDLNEMVCVGSA